MLPLVFQEYFIVLFRHTVDHPNLEMAMTVSYVPNGIDGSQCAYQCLTTDKEICVGKMARIYLKLLSI